MAKKRTNSKGLGRRVAHIGTRQVELKKKMEAEIVAVRNEMGQMFRHFESGKLRKEVRHEPRPVSEDHEIPYAPIFEERWRQAHKAWKSTVMAHLDDLVYVGEDEDGIGILADFNAQVRLPVAYLLTAEMAGDRYRWIKDHPYEQWKEERIGGSNPASRA